MLLERKRFGPLGWNIQYGFSLSDFAISKDLLKSFIKKSDEIPLDALNYMTSQANYGGRVTDKFDSVFIQNSILDYFNKDVTKQDYKIRNLYEVPELNSLKDWIDHCQNLSESLEVPELFGIHKNGDITSAKLETNKMMNAALLTIPRGGSGGGMSEDEVMEGICDKILKELPKEYNIEDVMRLKPVIRENSLNTVITQDVLRYNRLIEKI